MPRWPRRILGCGRTASAASAAACAAPRRRTPRAAPLPTVEGADDAGARPAVSVAVDESPHDARASLRSRARGPGGRAPVGAGRLPELRRQGQEHEPDRNVEPEDPLPRDAVDDRAADERAHGDGEARDARPGSERGTAPLAGDRGAENRQGQRRDDRGAESLQRPSRDQPVGRGCERGRGGRGGEDPDARA